MKFHELFIENFLTVRSAKVNLADRGLHLIQGINEVDTSATSNGAGKSSMVDAICWCLYGLTARDVKGDAVVNLLAKKDCRVTLTMSNGASIYQVVRHRKHATGKNALLVNLIGEHPADLSRGTDAETQKVVEQLLGCSYEVFVAAVYSGQEIMPDLPKMKDKELKMLIEESAGLQRIEKAYALSRERANACKNTEDLLKSKLDGFRANLAHAEGSLEAALEKFELWAAMRALRVDESRTIEIAAAIEVGDANAELIRAAKPLAAAKKRLAEIDAELLDHKRVEALAVVAEKAVRTIELSIDTGELKRLVAQVKLYEGYVANAAEEIKKPCEACGTVLETMTLEDFVEHRTAHLTVAQSKLADGKVKATKQVASLLEARTAAVAARGAVADVTALIAERRERATVEKDHSAAQVVATRAVANYDAAARQLELRKTEPNPQLSAVTVCRASLKDCTDKLAATSVSLEAASAATGVAVAVVKVFGPAGVRAQILDTVTPFLNDRTADYLSTLSDGEITATWTTLTKSASGDLKEKFSLDVTHAKGGDSFAAISGGEKRKVRLATALALQDLVASRATQPIDLWIGDEVDDALDPAGLERLMTILERKARERGTVIVISHSDLRDWVDDVTIVRKTAQWDSKIEGSLCT